MMRRCGKCGQKIKVLPGRKQRDFHKHTRACKGPRIALTPKASAALSGSERKRSQAEGSAGPTPQQSVGL